MTHKDIIGHGGKSGSGARSPRIAPDTLYNNSTAYIIDALGHGPIKGLIEEPSKWSIDGVDVSKEGSILFDNIPLRDFVYDVGESSGVSISTELNFDGVSWSERVGLPNDDIIEGFNQSVVSSVNAPQPVVTQSNPSEASFAGDVNIDSIVVIISVNALSRTYFQESGGNAAGSILPNEIEYKIEVKEGATSGYRQVLVDKIIGKHASPYQRQHLIQLEDSGDGIPKEYTVKVTRITSDFDDPDYENPAYKDTGDLRFNTIQGVSNLKIYYPGIAKVGLHINSREFGDRLLSRQYDVEGLKILVPTNYDTETKTYTGFWDGGFNREYSNNPAWVVYDLITNRNYGLGSFVSPEFINKFKLYSIAQYCDAVVPDPDNPDNFIFEGVPDGKGGVEPRYTFNAIINNQVDAYNLITSFCGMMAVMPYAGSAGLDFGQDSPREPDIVVSPANIIEGTQRYSSSEVKEMYSRINVTWINPDNKYNTEMETVQDADLIQRFGVRELDVTAYACTSQGQARRYAKLLLDNELYGAEILSYQCGLDHAYIRPGMVIAHSDPQHDSIRKSGRLKPFSSSESASSWTASFTLDAPYTFEENVTYTLTVIDKYGKVHTGEVVNSGQSSIATVTSYDLNDKWHEDIENNSMYMITSDNIEQRLFRVISIQQQEDNIFEVTAVLHDPNKYARVEKNEILPPPITSEYPTSPRLSSIDVKDINHQEFLYLEGAQVQAGVLFSWDQPKNYTESGINIGDARISAFEVQFKYTPLQTTSEFSAEWISQGLTNALSMDIKNLSTGTYVFRVRGQDDSSRKSNWSEYGPVYLDILMDPPSIVQNFRGHATSEQMLLSWDKAPELNVSGYEIRFNSSQVGATWAGSNKVDIEVSSEVTSVEVPLTTGSYLIKAFTFANKYSGHASIVVSNMASSYNYNAIETVSEDTEFIGVKTRTEVDSSELRLTKQPDMDDWGVLDGVVTMDYGSAGYIPDGYYEFAGVVDLTDIFTSSVSFNMDADIVDLTGTGDPELSNIFFNPLKTAVPLSGNVAQLAEGEDLGVIVQVSQTSHSLDLTNVDDNGSDVTATVSAGGAGNVNIFTADNDYLIIGSPDTFDDINFVLDTASSTDIAATFEYSTGTGAWATFTPTDDTEGFTESGRVIWDLADIPAWTYGAGSEFLIRITRTENTIVTTPVLDTVQNMDSVEDMCNVLDNAADVTSTVSSGGAGNVTIFDADNDSVTIGCSDKFNNSHFVLKSVSSADIDATFEFSTGVDSWNTFTPTDDTNGFTQSGTIDWSISSIPTWTKGANNRFLVKITRTKDTLTSPVLDKVEKLHAVWGDYNPITFNDYTARAFKFRLYMFTTNFSYSPSISTLEVSVDMTDRVASSSSTVASGASAKTITYGNAFYATPSVGITAHNMVSGDYYTITSDTKTGFTIEFKNSSNTTIDVNFDWVAKGYGTKQ